MEKTSLAASMLKEYGQRKINKKYFRSLFLTGIFFLVIQLNVSAQSPTDATVKFTFGQGTFFVALPDTNIAEIELVVGSKSNLNDLFANTFIFDQATGLPGGTTYLREGLHAYFGLGTISPPLAYFSKVRLKRPGGNWGDWYEFVSN